MKLLLARTSPRIEADQRPAHALRLCEQLGEVSDGARQAVELGEAEHIAHPQRRQSSPKLIPIVGWRAAADSLVGDDLSPRPATTLCLSTQPLALCCQAETLSLVLTLGTGRLSLCPPHSCQQVAGFVLGRTWQVRPGIESSSALTPGPVRHQRRRTPGRWRRHRERWRGGRGWRTTSGHTRPRTR